jgi:glucose-1-phosphate thymidylyltransferase
MICLILAGGFATRLYPLTVNKAKALLEYKGKPVISHIIDKIPREMKILVSTNRKFEEDFWKWQRTLERPVEICIEEAVTDEQKKGAVGAIDFWVKTKNITDDLLVIAADNYFDLQLAELIKAFDRRNPLIAVFDVGDKEKACEIGKACQLGLVILEGNRVIRLDEKPPEATSSVLSTGVYVLPAGIFPVLSKYCAEKKRDNLGSFISYLLERENVRAYTFSGTWVDIGDEIKKGNAII